ncbi:hypothetical protein ACP70R_038054 [Stipagrostis hirtigluma subsp. patula]
MAPPLSSDHTAYLWFVILTFLLPAAAAAATSYSSYSSLCHFPIPAPDLPVGLHSNGTQAPLPQISTGHFSGGVDLLFAPDRSYTPRSFSFFPRRSARTTDSSVVHLFARLILEGTGLDGIRLHHTVSFDLDGFYSTVSTDLCMVGSGSYPRDDGFGNVVLSDVALHLHLPHPSNLTRPFVTGRLEGASFGTVTLVAYADDDYAYAETASCSSSPPAPVRAGRRVLQANFSCSRLRALLRGSYSLGHGPGVHAAAISSTPWLRHQRMYVNQMRCGADGAVRVYMVFYADQSDAFPSGHSVEWRDGLLFLVGDEAVVADGFWDTSRSQLCLTACRVARSGPSRADLAVGECGIGVSFWFPAVWSFRDQSTVAGLIWNTSRESDGDTADKLSGVISLSRTGSYMGDLSDITYNYTMVEEAKRHYHSTPVLSEETKSGRFPGNNSCRDFAFRIFLKKQGRWSGFASPVAIGSIVVQGDSLMADDVFSRRAAAEVNTQRLLNVSYDLQLEHVVDSSPEMPQRRRISAEGVYDTKTGFLCMVACQFMDTSSDCEVLVTVQFAPVNAELRETAVGTISSLRKESDPLFFEAQHFDAYGKYGRPVQWDESSYRMEMELVMVVASVPLSCVLIFLQLRHAKRNPEAVPATSITMLVVQALGYMVPLVFMNSPTLRLEQKSYRWLELAGFIVLRVSTMLAFVLQLRLLRLALSGRSSRTRSSNGVDVGASAAAAEWKTFRVCLLLYLLGGVVNWIVYDVAAGGGTIGRTLALSWPSSLIDDPVSYGGLILDAFLLPQVVRNAFSGARAPALSPWFYAGGTALRAAPHVYDALRAHSYVASWRPSYVYGSPRDDLIGLSCNVAVLSGAALLAVLVFLQQRLGGAFLCGSKGKKSGRYEKVGA